MIGVLIELIVLAGTAILTILWYTGAWMSIVLLFAFIWIDEKTNGMLSPIVGKIVEWIANIISPFTDYPYVQDAVFLGIISIPIILTMLYRMKPIFEWIKDKVERIIEKIRWSMMSDEEKAVESEKTRKRMFEAMHRIKFVECEEEMNFQAAKEKYGENVQLRAVYTAVKNPYNGKIEEVRDFLPIYEEVGVRTEQPAELPENIEE